MEVLDRIFSSTFLGGPDGRSSAVVAITSSLGSLRPTELTATTRNLYKVAGWRLETVALVLELLVKLDSEFHSTATIYHNGSNA